MANKQDSAAVNRPNIELMTEVMDFIEDNQDGWDQRSWGQRNDCGTSHCFAGWTLKLSGVPMVWLADDYDDDPGTEYLAYADNGAENVGIDHVAAELLGLEMHEAWQLFSPDNTLDDLRTIVAYHKAHDSFEKVHAALGAVQLSLVEAIEANHAAPVA